MAIRLGQVVHQPPPAFSTGIWYCATGIGADDPIIPMMYRPVYVDA